MSQQRGRSDRDPADVGSRRLGEPDRAVWTGTDAEGDDVAPGGKADRLGDNVRGRIDSPDVVNQRGLVAFGEPYGTVGPSRESLEVASRHPSVARNHVRVRVHPANRAGLANP